MMLKIVDLLKKLRTLELSGLFSKELQFQEYNGNDCIYILFYNRKLQVL